MCETNECVIVFIDGDRREEVEIVACRCRWVIDKAHLSRCSVGVYLPPHGRGPVYSAGCREECGVCAPNLTIPHLAVVDTVIVGLQLVGTAKLRCKIGTARGSRTLPMVGGCREAHGGKAEARTDCSGNFPEPQLACAAIVVFYTKHVVLGSIVGKGGANGEGRSAGSQRAVRHGAAGHHGQVVEYVDDVVGEGA